MLRVILFLIGFCLFCVSFTAKAEEILIESIPSTEGVALICDRKKLDLRVYGETFRAKVVVAKKRNILEVLSNTEYYDVPIVSDERSLASQVVFTVKKKYFVKNNKIVSGISLDSQYKKDAQDEFSVLSVALNEAHAKNKCLSWNFE